ncbi:MAG: LURP-one-related family protein [Bdellovibrionales bacterium]|nr:LURP-one-related family protein [Bdellovibrionales bacterium]
MKFYMKQALLSFGSDFSVKDEHGKEVYYFDGLALSIRSKTIVKDANREEIARITRKLFTFAPTYRLTKGRQELATISKKLFTFRPAFTISRKGKSPITVIGKLLEHEYRFFREREEIATCSKKWFTGKDTYGIEVKSSSEALLVLSAAVIIDLICHPKRDSSF